MEAIHPITKQLIKILRSDATIIKDNKTLLYVRSTFSHSKKYNRYTVVISEFEALEKIVKPHIIIIKNNSVYEKFKSYIESIKTTNKDVILVVGKSIAEKINHDQMIVIDEIHEYYPMIEEELSEKSSDEMIITALAYILRFNKLILTKPESSNKMLEKWLNHGTKVEYVNVDSNDSIIPQTYQIIQYYKHVNVKRMGEIDFALKKNIENEYIDKIVLITDEGVDESKLPANEKLIVVKKNKRMTYGETFDIGKSVVPEGKEHILIFSNADISFDNTLRNLWSLKMKEKRLFLALLRYEYNSSSIDDIDNSNHKIFGPRADSQDTWIFSRDCLDFDTSKFDYNYGIPGCDNIITIDMFRNKFLVANPAYSIKTYHHHESNIRNYHPQKDILYRPVYMHVVPTYIQSFNVVKDFKHHGTNEVIFDKLQTKQSFEVKVETVDKSMSKYEKNFLYTPINKNNLIHFTNKNEMYISHEGLISDYDSIYIGRQKLYEEMWTKNIVSTLTPILHIPCMIADTTPSNDKNLGKFLLNNIPNILQIRAYATTKYNDEPEFFIPPFDDIHDVLKCINWPILKKTEHASNNVTINPYRTGVQYMSNNVYGYVNNSEDSKNISIENVEVLRELFKVKSNKSSGPTVCIIVNNEGLINEKLAEQIKNIHFVKKSGTEEESKWNVFFLKNDSKFKEILSTLSKIDWLITEEDSNINDYLYMMKKGSKVLEFRKEEYIEGVSNNGKGGCEYLCGACKLKYIMGVVRYREPLIDQRQNILVNIGKALIKFGMSEIIHMMKSEEKVKIIKPAGKALTGIHIHSNDSFREMIDLWNELGLIHLELSEETPYVWFDKIGDVLLYDRDTNMWIENDKVNYRFGLFGNSELPGPIELEKTRQSVWSYWPRYPKLVKSFIESNKVNKSFEDRCISSLFLGKIENNVQMRNRSKHDWSECIELFECPIDSSGRAYKYSQSEYLEKLCDAKYGLSLAGYGPKCHREIEYFACGVVPLVAPECDMDRFLNPLKEDVHYFRVKSPEEVEKIIKETPKEVWEKMSNEGKKWYANNCSAEGVFKLTFERIKQVNPYVGIGLPKWLPTY
jgi:hypothetical protein